MPITYNIQKDYLYQQGIKIGKEQLLQTFIQQLTVKFPQMPDEEIAGLANTTADHVKQIRNELAKNAKKK